MKRHTPDPRKELSSWLRFSIIFLILMPFIYINFKFNKVINIILVLSIAIIIWLLMKQFYHKVTEEYKLHNSISGGYMFSGGWFVFALIFMYAILTDYFKQNVFPTTMSLTLTITLLFFSFVLFYFANKSRKYEKSILHYPQKLQLLDIFLIGFLAIVLLAIVTYVVWIFIYWFFSQFISPRFIISGAILLLVFIVLLLYAKHRKLFSKL